MAWVTEREERLIGRVGPVLLRRFDELEAEWRAAWDRVGDSEAPPDLPALTRMAIEQGLPRALELQREMAQRLVAEGVPLQRVVSAVLLWEEAVRRLLVRDAVEDVFTGAAAVARLVHGLVLAVAEGHWEALREERDRVRRTLEEADRLKSEIISMISHDLKTPLTTIQGCAVSMLEAETDEAQRERFLRMILQNAERLSRLISQIVEVSRIEAGALDLEAEPVDGASVVRRLVESILPQAAIELRLDPNLPWVQADRDALERILLNLIDNAIRYSPPGQRIVVEGRRGEGFVEFRVADWGPGVPPERQGGLFSKFYQVDPSPSGRRGGTGLGLAIVRGLAEAMGGEAGYEPNRPTGSVFWVRLPRAEAVEGAR